MSAERALALATPAEQPARTDRLTQSWQVLALALFAFDAAALGLSFALSYYVRFKAPISILQTVQHSRDFYSWVAVWAIPVWLGIFAVYRLYDRRFLFAGFQEYARIVNACTAGMIFVIVVSYLGADQDPARGWLLLTWVFAILLVATERFTARRALRALAGGAGS